MLNFFYNAILCLCFIGCLLLTVIAPYVLPTTVAVVTVVTMVVLAVALTWLSFDFNG